MGFSAEFPCNVTPDELLKRICSVELDEEQKKVLALLLEGGSHYGYVVRDRWDDDAHMIGRGYRLEYERGVDDIVAKRVSSDHREIALDLSLLAYQEGHRLSNKVPHTLIRVREALAG